VLTEIGPVEIEVPRDRDGSFEPVIVPKRKRRLDGIDQIVLSLSARGLTTGPDPHTVYRTVPGCRRGDRGVGGAVAKHGIERVQSPAG